MKTIYKDLLIIGGGPAGLAAAYGSRQEGIEDILIIERDHDLGGILNQCIHNGFGLHTFKEELTGPEYAEKYIDLVEKEKIETMTETMVLSMEEEKEEQKDSQENSFRYKKIVATGSRNGIFLIKAKAVILAMGCRERPRGALNIPGYRPAGVFAAGTAQRLVNIEGKLPGKEVVILGSGDIGLIMARRMTLEGAKVHCVAEIMPYSGGLKRNIVQCLNDYDIPLYLSHTVTEIKGRERVEGVVIAQVDENLQPISGTEKEYSCDTLLLSVGLIPENEVSLSGNIELSSLTNGPLVDETMETNVTGVFACGNVLHVHDLVDFVSEEAERAGHEAGKYIKLGAKGHEVSTDSSMIIKRGINVRYTVPYKINLSNERFSPIEEIQIRFRVTKTMGKSEVRVFAGDEQVKAIKRRVMAPGEMEGVKIKREWLEKGQITIEAEEVEA